MKKAFIYLVVFMAIQIVIGGVVAGLWQLIAGNSDVTATRMVTITVVVGIITIAIFLLMRWAEVSPRWLRTRPWTVLAWSVVAALGALIPSAALQEMMPELPNWAENEFEALLGKPVGYLAIGLLAPLSEEIVMRGAILKELLKSSRLSPWGAIIISGVLFALVHMNPVQMPHAFLIGLFLGWMYWRTGSILPGVAYHWANNSAAFVLYHFFPDPDMKLSDMFMGNNTNVILAIVFSLLILLPALYQLNLWMKRAEEGVQEV